MKSTKQCCKISYQRLIIKSIQGKVSDGVHRCFLGRQTHCIDNGAFRGLVGSECFNSGKSSSSVDCTNEEMELNDRVSLQV